MYQQQTIDKMRDFKKCLQRPSISFGVYFIFFLTVVTEKLETKNASRYASSLFSSEWLFASCWTLCRQLLIYKCVDNQIKIKEQNEIKYKNERNQNKTKQEKQNEAKRNKQKSYERCDHQHNTYSANVRPCGTNTHFEKWNCAYGLRRSYCALQWLVLPRQCHCRWGPGHLSEWTMDT